MTYLLNKAEDIIFWAMTSILGSAAVAGGWLVRRVFTNQQEIEMLKADLKHREQLRNEDRDRITNIEKGVATIQEILMERN